MELKHFKCPSCGANLEISIDSTEAKCDYCGQSFIIDDTNAIVTEMERQQKADHKVKMMVFIGVALFIGLITIAIVLFTTLAPNGFGKSNESDNDDIVFSSITTVSANIPEINVEKDYYSFRNESITKINFDKNGEKMGFSTTEEYEMGANEIIDDPDTLARISSDGARIYYNEEKNFFVELYADGALRLFFIPEEGKYFFDNK